MSLLDRSLLIVTGKGGVGRSAVSTALALRAARQGRQVLLIGMTDQLGLASHLGVDHLSYRPSEVRAGLNALAIEPASALDEYLRIQLHVPRLGPMTRVFRVLAETVPGVRDTVIMGKVLHEAVRGPWDLVIADAPPTGQVVSYLRAPSTIEHLVPTGRVEDQAAWMRQALESPRMSALVMVAVPEELPVIEAEQSLTNIGEEGLVGLGALVANRVLDDLAVSTTVIAGLDDGPHREAALLHEQLYERQQHWLDRLKADLALPLLFGMLTPGEVAARLADEGWESV